MTDVRGHERQRAGGSIFAISIEPLSRLPDVDEIVVYGLLEDRVD